MGHELHLVSDLALILISAGVITIIFKLLKQPLVLGYLVAGFLIGPHFRLFPSLIAPTSVKEWSEIGIIFLLFALGLEFNIKKLLKVGRTAMVTSITQMLTMLCIGFITGYFLGWTTIESLILAGMLVMSSTTIVIKAFGDLGLRNHKFADISLVVLIMEDIIAILMLVIIPAIAVSQQFAGKDIVFTLLKFVFFIILWFVVGISIIPTFFRKLKSYINDETLLIISIGLCFGMVVFANYVGFSSALGAFVMGSILSESTESKNIESLTKSIKDLFGVIFFVSVGMMVNPIILAEYWQPIIIITFITLIGKAFFSVMGVLIAGESLKVSIQTGFSLAQIGEFAFIIATLGVSLGILRDFIYPVIVAVSFLTTFTTPYFIRFATPFYNWLEPHIPPHIRQKLDEYVIMGIGPKGNSDWKIILKTSLLRSVIFTVICIAIIYCAFHFLYPFVFKILPDDSPQIVGNFINAFLTLGILAPFLLGLMTNNHSTHEINLRLWRMSRLSRTGVVTWTLFRIFLATFFVILVLLKCFQFKVFVGISIALAIVFFILFSRNTFKRFSKMEENFIKNLESNDGSKKSNEERKESD